MKKELVDGIHLSEKSLTLVRLECCCLKNLSVRFLDQVIHKLDCAACQNEQIQLFSQDLLNSFGL